MTKKELEMYQTYKKRREKLKNDIENLKTKDIESVCGKVKGSMKQFPYTECRFSVQMEVPEEKERVCKQIDKKKKEIEELEERMREIEQFIDNIKDVSIKSIFEYRYLEGITCEKIGGKIGYTHGRISQVISGYLQQENSVSET